MQPLNLILGATEWDYYSSTSEVLSYYDLTEGGISGRNEFAVIYVQGRGKVNLEFSQPYLRSTQKDSICIKFKL